MAVNASHAEIALPTAKWVLTSVGMRKGDKISFDPHVLVVAFVPLYAQEAFCG